MRRFLISNDDGISSRGLRHLVSCCLSLGEVFVVAPDQERSGSGMSITVHHPLRLSRSSYFEELGVKAFTLNGTPADCVKIGLDLMKESPPDLVISGINHGTNEGRNVLYSGTVACAIEAALRGLPACGFSAIDYSREGLLAAEAFIPQIINFLIESPLPKGSLMNVNFPKEIQKGVQGVELATQGKSYWLDAPTLHQDPSGNPYLWLGGKISLCEEEPTSDVALLKRGYVTAVPLHIGELSDRLYQQEKANAFKQSFMSTALPKSP